MKHLAAFVLLLGMPLAVSSQSIPYSLEVIDLVTDPVQSKYLEEVVSAASASLSPPRGERSVRNGAATLRRVVITGKG